MNGLVLIDKPAGCTSHDVVNRWRKMAATTRAGHLGTLDPMATGLLALVTGPATRLAQYYGKEDKTYEAEITLGVSSDTYDAEGVVAASGVPIPSAEEVDAALAHFRGRFSQKPPAVSAKKIGGVPAYKLARQNVPVDLRPVVVEVKSLEVRSIEGCRVAVRVSCTAGTYIRSIAHDLGVSLGCGALLSRLRRTDAGEFSVHDARTIEELESLAAGNRLSDAVIPAARLLSRWPAEHFDTIAEFRIRQGRDFRTSPFVVPSGSPFMKALSRTGDLIAIGELKIPNLYHPTAVF